MRFVKLSYGSKVFYVVPEQVVYLLEMGEDTTGISLQGGHQIKVEGSANDIGLQLQDRRRPG